MPPPADIAVVIPCFNEQRSIGPLVRSVREHVDRVLVVDDGSADQTGAAARAEGAMVIELEGNRGKGAALQAGLARADAMGCRFAITMDGDGQHSPDDLPQFIRCAVADDVDLVIGNRMAACMGMPGLRRWVNRWMSRSLSRKAGVELPDTQCGYRLIRIGKWRELQLSTSRFEVESEMLMAFVRMRARIRFVPVQTIYKSEQSKIHPLHDTLRWLRWWWKARD